MDAAAEKALQDLATLFVKQELAPILAELIAKLPATYAPLVSAIETAVLPAIEDALMAQIAKI